MGIFAVLLGSEDALLPTALGCFVICLLIIGQDSGRSCRRGRLPTGTWTSSSHTEPEINGQVPSMLGSARGPQVCTGGHGGSDAHRERLSWDPVSLSRLHLWAWSGRTLSPLHLPEADGSIIRDSFLLGFLPGGMAEPACSRGLLDSDVGLSLGVQQSAELGSYTFKMLHDLSILPVFPGAYISLCCVGRGAGAELLYLS